MSHLSKMKRTYVGAQALFITIKTEQILLPACVTPIFNNSPPMAVKAEAL